VPVLCVHQSGREGGEGKKSRHLAVGEREKKKEIKEKTLSFDHQTEKEKKRKEKRKKESLLLHLLVLKKEKRGEARREGLPPSPLTFMSSLR